MPDFATLFTRTSRNALQILSYATAVLMRSRRCSRSSTWCSDGARRRTRRSHPGLGTIGAIHYFLVLSLLVFIAGAANLTYGVRFQRRRSNPETTRYSWSMFVGSALFFGDQPSSCFALSATAPDMPECAADVLRGSSS